ncbi:MAG: YheT family hydrolase [Planctomycetota bacterium]
MQVSNTKSVSQSAFRPPWYLRSGHLQTLITGFYRPIADLPPLMAHRCPLGPVGDNSLGNMLVHENSPQSPSVKADLPAVLLLHGLGSSHTGTYMTNIAQGLVRKGYRVFRADLPGAGNSYLETPMPPHGACYDAIRNCLEHLSQTLHINDWNLAGISLGGNILLRMLGEWKPGRVRIHRAIAVAPPIDLDASCKNVEKGINRLYASYFLRALRKQSRLRGQRWPQWQERLNQADYRSLRRFDNTVTAPLAGFKDSQEYYAAGSSIRWLSGIRAKVKILVDRHDPIVPYSLFPHATYSSTTELIVTDRGGHVGYLRKGSTSSGPSPRRFERWADRWIVETLTDDSQW